LRFIERDLARHGVAPTFYRLEGRGLETRTCPTIVDPVSGRVTEIREPGPIIGGAEAEGFFEHFQALLEGRAVGPAGRSSGAGPDAAGSAVCGDGARDPARRPGPAGGAAGAAIPAPGVVTLSGSLPPGLPADFYARLIRIAAERRVPCILDTSGAPLRAGAAARPWAVKVNEAELMGLEPREEGVAGTARPDAPGGHGSRGCETAGAAAQDPLIDRLVRLVETGVALAVVTRGRKGLLAYDGRTLWRGTAPGELEIIQPVGSGDAAAAALAVRLERWLESGLLPPPDAAWPRLGMGRLPESERVALIRDMVAAGAANAVTEGVGTCPAEVFAAFRKRVRVQEMATPSPARSSPATPGPSAR